MIRIERFSPEQARAAEEELVALLQDSVASGASVGFLPPLAADAAKEFWRETFAEMERGKRILLVAREEGRGVGAVQLELAAKPNASHRAEVLKLMVHTRARKRGIGNALMAAVEDAARSRGRTLLVLDTRRGDGAEQLYRKLGYVAAGIIPRYARSADGRLTDTVFFYRELA